ncbi:MAG TPA: phospho-N-acetylmuramoyl-pentapeptide-transferase [Candidatus Dormibacteraeota bacterium]|nr:phospho-N-acetylmuramoyl-pentapeptide-transferase [Candidatus Dormibacteraeota bacterium]
MLLDLTIFLVAFTGCVSVYPLLIRWFQRLRVGQVIQAELFKAHQRKAGTPTGGGILFVGVGIVGGLLAMWHHPGAIAPTVALCLYGLIGCVDDLAKLRFGQVGMPARIKFPLQVLFAIPIAVLARVPQHPLRLDLVDQWWYWPLAVGAIVGAANAVNLTDGLDGLAGGLAAIALLGTTFLLPGAGFGEQAVAMSLVGGVVAFLVFNRHPAQIFMGDTGSLGLGAALSAMAIEQGWVLLLLMIGLVFALETLSVIIQVGYFKVSGGRRIFKMTPIHLTFQLEGWSERRIALAFWAAGTAAVFASGWLAHSLL